MKNCGLSRYRFNSNSAERTFAQAWEKENTRPNSRGRQLLDYLLAEVPNKPAGEVIKRDRVVAATVVQWLGSPVGQCFLRDTQEIVEIEKEKAK